MSIAVLTQVYDEVRRLAIAGSVVAPGDFRLKKLVPPLEKAGEKAPVFAKVALSATKLINSNEKESAEALLELSSLVNAILYTQGDTAAPGELEPIETTTLSGCHTRTTARVLKPLLEALTNTGSGRLEVIKDAFYRGAFQDLRLIKPALKAIDDPYPEIADFVAEQILPLYGKAILPELQWKFDIKGKSGHARRLTLMHRLDPEATGPLVKEALDNGSKDVKVAAIECLGTWPKRLDGLLEPLRYLLEKAVSKSREVRIAAISGLAKREEPEALAVVEGSLNGDDMPIALAAIRQSDNAKLFQSVLAEADRELDAILSGKEKNKAAIGKRIERVLSLLECIEEKENAAVEKFLLARFSAREKLAAIKADPGGEQIVERLVELMAAVSPRTQDALVEARDSLSPGDLQFAFVAACKSRSAEQVFELFSPFLMAKGEPKKKTSGLAFNWGFKLPPVTSSTAPATMATMKRAAISGLLGNKWNVNWPDDFRSLRGDGFIERLDPRWLDVAVQIKDVAMLRELARPGHDRAGDLLLEAFKELIQGSAISDGYVEILQALVRINHPAAADAVIAGIKKHSNVATIYGFERMGQLIPQLPKTATVAFESLLPTLSDKMADELLSYVAELKNKP